jgi:hypothetical protein
MGKSLNLCGTRQRHVSVITVSCDEILYPFALGSALGKAIPFALFDVIVIGGGIDMKNMVIIRCGIWNKKNI